jgi:hypothetical protein
LLPHLSSQRPTLFEQSLPFVASLTLGFLEDVQLAAEVTKTAAFGVDGLPLCLEVVAAIEDELVGAFLETLVGFAEVAVLLEALGHFLVVIEQVSVENTSPKL